MTFRTEQADMLGDAIDKVLAEEGETMARVSRYVMRS